FRGLESQRWPGDLKLRTRAAIHAGTSSGRAEDYYGPTVNRCARLRAVARGGQILLSEAAMLLVRDHLPKGATLQDLGSHRLKDLLRAEQVFGLAHPDLPDFPLELASLGRTNHNLPVQLTSFVGRREELQQVGTMLQQYRLVTLLGPGGSGKTRLALQAAAEVVDEPFASVIFFDLQRLTPEVDIAAALGREMQIGELETGALAKVAAALGKVKTLLVLDNCEHLSEAIANLVQDLLTRSTELCVLATSREPLQLPSEARFPVAPLRLPRAGASATELTSSDAGQLFIERALLRKPDFEITDKTAASVAMLCVLLEGIPLAIEQAASHSALLSPVQMVSHFQERLKNLRSDERSIPRRHRSLRAAIDWSYEALSSEEQLFFTRCTVLRGAWTLEAADAICNCSELADISSAGVLQRLIDLSLVQIQDLGDESRFRMLQLIQDYGLEKLNDEETVRARHAEYYVGLVVELIVSHDARSFEHDHGKLVEALHWMASRDPEAALRSVVDVRAYLMRHGVLVENYALVTRVLKCNPDLVSPEQARCLNLAGALAYRIHENDFTQFWCQQSIRMWRDLGMEQETVAPLHNLALAAGSLGQSAQALALLLQIRGDFARLGDEKNEAVAMLNLGRLLIQCQRFDEAIETLTSAAEKLTRIAAAPSLNLALYNIAVCHLALRNEKEAFARLSTALAYWSASMPVAESTMAMAMMAVVAQRQGDIVNAKELMRLASVLQVIDGHHLAGVEVDLLAACKLSLAEDAAIPESRDEFMRTAFANALSITGHLRSSLRHVEQIA
ncbi:MAG TPA: NB-ARC domain-containing protein, partial [Fimbriimonas sp.]|nr:NB-ARC domain-containing protein [Fimbriimonas sp.]